MTNILIYNLGLCHMYFVWGRLRKPRKFRETPFTLRTRYVEFWYTEEWRAPCGFGFQSFQTNFQP